MNGQELRQILRKMGVKQVDLAANSEQQRSTKTQQKRGCFHPPQHNDELSNL